MYRGDFILTRVALYVATPHLIGFSYTSEQK